jgi:hypothetical protein
MKTGKQGNGKQGKKEIIFISKVLLVNSRLPISEFKVSLIGALVLIKDQGENFQGL